MRVMLLALVLFLGGCLSTQPPHNPMKKQKKEKAAAPAPSAPAAPSKKPKKAPKPDLELDLPEPEVDKVELMKEMFLVQQDLKAQILKLAEGLTEEELEELNKFLTEFGVTIQRKRVPRPLPDRRAF